MSTATARAPPGNSDSGFGSLHFPSRKTELWIVSTPSTMRVKKNSRPSGVKTPLSSIAFVLTTPGANFSGVTPGVGCPK